MVNRGHFRCSATASKEWTLPQENKCKDKADPKKSCVSENWELSRKCHANAISMHQEIEKREAPTSVGSDFRLCHARKSLPMRLPTRTKMCCQAEQSSQQRHATVKWASTLLRRQSTGSLKTYRKCLFCCYGTTVVAFLVVRFWSHISKS